MHRRLDGTLVEYYRCSYCGSERHRSVWSERTICDGCRGHIIGPDGFDAGERAAIAAVRSKGFAACLAEEVRREGGWHRDWMDQPERNSA